MRILALSDLHGNLPDIEPCDLLILGGDILPVAFPHKLDFIEHILDAQVKWSKGPLREWLDRIPAKRVVSIAGNHDFLFQLAPNEVPAGLRWTYLQDSGIEIDNLKLYGSPWQLYAGDWAFNAPQNNGELVLAEKYARIPEGTDVLISHGPPFGGQSGFHTHYADVRAATAKYPEAHVGSVALMERLKTLHPRLVVTGHIHEARGLYDIDCSLDRSKFLWPCFIANACHVGRDRKPAHPPMEFEWDEVPPHSLTALTYVDHEATGS